MPRLYHELAALWPLLSPPADYAPEAAQVRAVLRAYNILGASESPDAAAAPTLLELGAGGGHTLSHLAADFDCTAVDLAPEMLDMSRRLNPDCEHVEGDMRTLRLDRRFDCVLIHDAIDYMASADDARAAVATAAAHLKPGGVVILAPTYVSETFTDHEGELDVNTSPEGLEVAFLSRVARIADQPDSFELAMLLMVRDPATGLALHEDRHTCGLFAVDHWLALLRDAGLAASVTSFQPLDDESDEADDDGPPAVAELAPFARDAQFPQNIPWFVGHNAR